MNNESATMTINETLAEHILTRTEQEMNRLQEEAMAIVDRYWEWRTKENQSRKATEQSRLALRVHKRDGGAFQVEWYAYELRRTKKGEAKQRYISIKKGSGLRYPKPTLAQYARDWEIDHVCAIDAKLAKVRRDVRNLGRVRFAIRLYAQPDGLGHATPDRA
ncbi:MAG: conjugative transfer protein MobI(A/C) [Gammaproteobacteria bacterium]|nr:conjugative transfer protein MobI(A/C) [Gammaproteobacteria bacterium]